MSKVIIEEETSVTAKGYRHRTTIPSSVFKFLKLKDKDKLLWKILSDGTILIEKIQ
jgi:bifunctional DNA-binding transcriptional regulator/antitoxin component of YhaV-PrlF toxin-antitoxin module